jgi:hypothetical protein
MAQSVIPERWRRLTALLVPSLLLLPLMAFYVRFDGTPHFFLHTLMGWDVGLILLLLGAYYGQPPRWWDGLWPLGLALYALTPDFIYMVGPPHRDWMDVFLFHVALDEILPFAVLALAILWVVLLAGYIRFRLKGTLPSMSY